MYVIYLFSKKTSEVLDYRRFGAGWPASITGVRIETTPENIEQIINRGENRQVEFKLVIPKKWEEFAETAVAMLNGDGGTIFLGVDDNSSILGVEDPRIADSIHDALRNLCDPAVKPEITMQSVQGKTVGVIQVNSGSNKPYLLNVRVGSTDRIAFRDEIVNLATGNQLGVSNRPWT